MKDSDRVRVLRNRAPVEAAAALALVGLAAAKLLTESPLISVGLAVLCVLCGGRLCFLWGRNCAAIEIERAQRRALLAALSRRELRPRDSAR